MKRERTAFRQTARLAKTRLGSGFWSKEHKKASLENINNPDCEEERFYKRVESLLQSGDDNPLANLLDREYMATLDEASRGRYVLNLSGLVNKSIERYNQVTA
jgi:vacuolar-type H+-ATPase subunit C/Vma6